MKNALLLNSAVSNLYKSDTSVSALKSDSIEEMDACPPATKALEYS